MKTIAVKPGLNHFKVVGVQQHGTVLPREYTKSGWPKNTTQDLDEIIIAYNPDDGFCDIRVVIEK